MYACKYFDHTVGRAVRVHVHRFQSGCRRRAVFGVVVSAHRNVQLALSRESKSLGP